MKLFRQKKTTHSVVFFGFQFLLFIKTTKITEDNHVQRRPLGKTYLLRDTAYDKALTEQVKPLLTYIIC